MKPLLGHLDAEHVDETQRFLKHVFVETSATQLAQAHSHPFVIGRASDAGGLVVGAGLVRLRPWGRLS